jgi:hypothetical protein
LQTPNPGRSAGVFYRQRFSDNGRASILGFSRGQTRACTSEKPG